MDTPHDHPADRVTEVEASFYDRVIAARDAALEDVENAVKMGSGGLGLLQTAASTLIDLDRVAAANEPPQPMLAPAPDTAAVWKACEVAGLTTEQADAVIAALAS